MFIKTFFLLVHLVSLTLGNGTQETNFASSIKRRISRSLGGIPVTDIGPFGYHVAIRSDDEYGCGGAIISRRNVLTAAHCVDHIEGDVSRLTIRSGSVDRELLGIDHKVKNFTMHPDYSLNEFYNSMFDIAVIRVDEPFVYDDVTKKIELFNHNEEAKPGAIGLVTGWGVDESDDLSDVLKYVKAPIVSKDACNKSYQKFGGIHDGEICAGTGKGIGTRPGDSGGPLVIKKRLAGIAAYAEGKDFSEYPGVFAEVAYFRKWIDRYAEYDQE